MGIIIKRKKRTPQQQEAFNQALVLDYNKAIGANKPQMVLENGKPVIAKNAQTSGLAQVQAQAQAAETPQQAYARQAQEVAQQHQIVNPIGQAKFDQTINRLQTTPGFRPEQAAAMQHQAYKLAQRQGQMSQRALLGEQSQRGIGGRSGIGYAQQRDINKGVAAQQAQSMRDFQRLNAEEGKANAAGGIAAEAGEIGRYETDIESLDEKERRRKYQASNPPTQQFMKIG